MAIIADLAVSLTARTQKFSQGLSKAGKQLSGFRKRITGFGVAVGAIATGAMAHMVKRTLDAIDAQAKFADRIGISQSALGGLTLAAELTGNSQKQLELGLQRMTRRLAEAAQGTGEARTALDALGLNIKDIQNLSPDQQFARIADAMAGVSGASEKVRIAFKLFDTEGVGLVNTLALGSDGLRAVQMQAEAMGLALSRDMGAKAEEANDAMGILWGQIKGFANTLAISLAPLITKVSDSITDWISNMGGMKEVVDTLTWLFDGLFKGVRAGFRFMRVFVLDIAEDIADLSASILDFFGGDETAQFLRDFAKAARDELAEIDRMGAKSFFWDDAPSKTKEFRDNLKAATRDTKDLADALDGVTKRDFQMGTAKQVHLGSIAVGNFPSAKAQQKVTDDQVAGLLQQTNNILSNNLRMVGALR